MLIPLLIFSLKSNTYPFCCWLRVKGSQLPTNHSSKPSNHQSSPRNESFHIIYIGWLSLSHIMRVIKMEKGWNEQSALNKGEVLINN